MHTFIISSENIEQALEEAIKLSKEARISQFDIERLEFEKALGIEDVRSIQKSIFLKPFQSNIKATIIVSPNGATIEAQNSMLKLLEEPPSSSIIFLITQNHLSFLPTILSRVKLIKIKSKATNANGNSFSEILKLKTIGDRLLLAQDISKEKGEAINFLEEAILSARDAMLKSLNNKNESLRLRKLIHKLELTHYDLKTTNTNARLALENLFLSV